MLSPDARDRMEYFDKFAKPHLFESLRYRSLGVQIFWAAQAALFAAWAASHNVALIFFGLTACISYWLYDERNRYFMIAIHKMGEEFADKYFFPCDADGRPVDGIHVRIGKSIQRSGRFRDLRSHTVAIRFLLISTALAWVIIGLAQLHLNQTQGSGGHMPFDGTVQNWSNVASIVTAAAATITMLFLIWYTIETSRLRKAAQRQNSIPFMPIVVVDIAPMNAQGGHLTLGEPAIRNIGSGPAFQIELQTLRLGEHEIRFAVVALVERDKPAKLDYTIWQGGQTSGFSKRSVLLQSVLSGSETRLELPLVITFRDMAGTRYGSRAVIVYDPMAKEIKTEYGSTTELP